MFKSEDIASVYTHHIDDLFTYAVYLGFDKSIVMDAIHDVFCKLAADKSRIETIDNLKFYLFRSLKNRLYDMHKTRKEHIDIENIHVSQDMPFNISVTIEDTLIEEEEQIQIRTQIEEMLDALTARQREIIYLRYVQEYDYEEIAELLHISVHGCRKLVSKAIQSLREKYGPSLISLLLLSLKC